ncbi:ribosome biogenesis protein SLX9-domain-containing protein [Daldinia sp. FL1419]|nr:ribosome biogenesis protein SLX9-domain-containing protein [Daldinia sp. FL1419]
MPDYITTPLEFLSAGKYSDHFPNLQLATLYLQLPASTNISPERRREHWDQIFNHGSYIERSNLPHNLLLIHPQAPVVPSKRRSLRAKLAARSGPEPYAPRKAPRPDAVETSDSFSNTKKDKRTIKHASFVSRIEKANQKAPKRRRPSKKLVANLDSLADALPDLLAGGETEEGLRQMREGKIRHKSLKSRPGALKRKERIVKGEVERFGVSLARLSAVAEKEMDVDQSTAAATTATGTGEGMTAQGQTQAPVQVSTTNRWAALRGFISATMEQNPAFVGKQDGK